VPVESTDVLARLLVRFAAVLGRYHGHRVLGLRHLGRLLEEGRRVIAVGNHVLDTTDPFLFVAEVVRRYGCAPRFIGHENIIFRVPGLNSIAKQWKVIPSRDAAGAADALEHDRFLMLFPGAATEALVRSYRDEPYTLKWEGRLGFLRLALEADADIVFIAAVGTEEMYYQTRLPTPEWILSLLNAGDVDRYRGAPLTLGLLGPHLLPGIFPFPAQLTHHVSPPIRLNDRRAALESPAALAQLHRRVWADCQTFLDDAVAERGQHTTYCDWVTHRLHGTLRWLGL
jgi:1-acyl-sn-glycerol-3-phosphate acyltransferase